MNTKPFTFQVKDARHIHRLGGRALLAQEMGLGKSLISLLYLHRHPGQGPAVVVCPASLKWNWENEAVRHFGMRGEVLEGTKPPKGGWKTPHSLVIINYDILGPWLDYLKDLKPGLIILDECQLLQSRKSLRTRCCQALTHGVDRVLALSGTPLLNRPAELWPTLNILRPDLYPSFTRFAFNHCRPRRAPWGWEYKGASRLPELHQGLCDTLMIRRLKKDVLHELPDKTRSVVPLELPPAGAKEYGEAQRDFLAWLAKQDPVRARRAARAEKLTRVGYLKRLAGRLKISSVIKWVREFLEGCEGKLILFAVHKTVISALTKEFKKVCVVVDGSTPSKSRRLAVRRFQQDPGVRVFLGNVRAAGVGLTLTAASRVAFAELDWVPGVHTQCEDRAHRIGQKGNTSVYYLVARGTVEEHLLKIIQTKQGVLNQTLDGVGKGDGLDVYDLLCESLISEGSGFSGG